MRRKKAGKWSCQWNVCPDLTFLDRSPQGGGELVDWGGSGMAARSFFHDGIWESKWRLHNRMAPHPSGHAWWEICTHLGKAEEGPEVSAHKPVLASVRYEKNHLSLTIQEETVYRTHWAESKPVELPWMPPGLSWQEAAIQQVVSERQPRVGVKRRMWLWLKWLFNASEGRVASQSARVRSPVTDINTSLLKHCGLCFSYNRAQAGNNYIVFNPRKRPCTIQFQVISSGNKKRERLKPKTNVTQKIFLI